MRYVLDTPLHSIRADLGLSPLGSQLMPYASTRCTGHSDTAAKVLALGSALARIEVQLVQLEADKVTIDNIREQAAADTTPRYVQHEVTATVHRLRPGDGSRSICGISIAGATFRARRQDRKTYLPIDTIAGIPGILLCDRCLKIERINALENELIDTAISGDEVEV